MFDWLWRRLFPSENPIREQETRVVETFKELRAALQAEDESRIDRLRETLTKERESVQ